MMYWHRTWTDSRKREFVSHATLYLYHYADAEYDGDNSTMVELGGCWRRDDGRFTAYVAYAFAPRKSNSPYYSDQTRTRDLDGDFADYQDATAAVQEHASRYFTQLARQVRGLKNEEAQ